MFRVAVIQRTDCCAERFHHMQVHVGYYEHAGLAKNELCSMFEGPAKTGAINVMTCEQFVEGNKVVFSSTQERTGHDSIGMEEIILLGARTSRTTISTTESTPLDNQSTTTKEQMEVDANDCMWAGGTVIFYRDSKCDDENNIAECLFDGGDCCQDGDMSKCLQFS